MSEQKMSDKKFIRAKLSGRTTAEGFLAAHMEFLKGHSYLEPVLDAYENGDLLPTPTIQACQQAILNHVIESEAQKAHKATVEKQQASTTVIKRGDKVVKSTVPSGKYAITLMCKVYERGSETPKIEVGTVEKKKFREVKKNGVKVLEPYTEIVPAVWSADSYSDANRLADRRLFDRGDSMYAEIVNTQGVPIKTTIQRDDAIARMMQQPKGPAARAKGTSTKTLKWVGKAKNDLANFSRG